MKISVKLKRVNIPETELISDLHKVARILQRNHFTRDEYDKHGIFSGSTIKKRFGTWNNALIQAGLSIVKRMNVGEEELLDNLMIVWEKLGRQPRQKDLVKPISRFSVATYKKRFGTYNNALQKLAKETTAPGNSISISQKQNTQGSLAHNTKRDINLRLRFLTMKRDNFKCKKCGKSPAIDPSITLHVDHIKPWAKGGETVIENLQTLCSKCNIGKSDLE